MKFLLALAVGLGLILTPVIASAGIAQADTSITCEDRGYRHYEENGREKDTAFHVSRGELPTCHDDDKTTVSRPTKKSKKDRDGKSRFCRKHWWC